MLALLFTTCIIAVAMSLSNIQVEVDGASQDYFFRINLYNINAAACGTSISSVSILVNGAYVSSDAVYNGNEFKFDYKGTKFGDMLPISLRIKTGASTIDLPGIVKNLNGGAKFTADKTICQGETAKPTTPKPTSRPTAPTTPFPTAESVCINKNSIVWTSKNNQIYLNGNRFNMKGLSWFGFETTNYNLYGLDRHNMNWYFQWMVDNDFNAIRMPFSSDFINAGTSNLNQYVNAVKAAGEYGLLIMLDMHSKTPGNWRDGLYTINQADEINTWKKVAAAMVNADVWNVLFVDVFNEPHDVKNSQWTSWVEFCENVAEAVWSEGLDALIAVEGTNSDCSPISCCWGENLEGPRLHSGKVFEASKADKYVWSPHVYTGDVTGNYQYNNDGWKNHWGYLVDRTEAPIVIGEFGTRGELTWLGALTDYLISIDQRNHFFWCLNPNSGDTGGLLKDDWTTPETAKLTILDRLQPNPSKITVSSNKICVSGLGSGGGSTPVSSPTPKPVNSPTPKPVSAPTPTPAPVNSGGGSGTIRIKQNGGVSGWWFAVEFPDGNINQVTKLEYRDSSHTSWVNGNKLSWGAFTFPHGGKAFNGKMHFRITTSAGRKANWNVFNGVSPSSTATLTTASAFTEEDTVGSSSLTWAGLAAIIVCSLLCILCIGGGIWYYKKNQINKGEASFATTAADTPEPSKGNDTPQGSNDEEIEVEMNVTTDGVTTTEH